MKRLSHLLLVTLIIIPSVSFSLESKTAVGHEIMIATDHPLASKAGLEIHNKGGNIIDVASAVSFAISVVKPYSTGIGGGGFLLYHDASTKKTESFDFRERAPLKATRNMYIKNGKVTDDTFVGIRSVAVPGIVKGIVQIHQRYGRLSLQTVMAPAIQYAEQGFEVYPALQSAIEKQKKYILDDPEMSRVFLPKGAVPAVGEMIVNKDLAKTLRAIASEGEGVFYRGWIAQKIVSFMEQEGGLISHRDLQKYKMIKRDPIAGSYRGLNVISMGPPSSGGIHIVQMLNMLEPYKLSSLKRSRAPYQHLVAEVMRRAYKDRAEYLGDPDQVKVPSDRLVSKKYAKLSMLNFSADKATDNGAKRGPLKEPFSTTNFSIMDAKGNAVASTQTINYRFGSVVMVPGTGIILNDEMDDFAASPGVPNRYGLVGGDANAIAPQKTPLSSMSPTFVLKDGKVDLVVGAPGGSHIITGVLQAILNVYDFGDSVGDALATPRVHHQYLPNKIMVEADRISPRTAGDLKAFGHELKIIPRSGSRLSAVKRVGNTLVGATDPRGTGEPFGK